MTDIKSVATDKQLFTLDEKSDDILYEEEIYTSPYYDELLGA